MLRCTCAGNIDFGRANGSFLTQKLGEHYLFDLLPIPPHGDNTAGSFGADSFMVVDGMLTSSLSTEINSRVEEQDDFLCVCVCMSFSNHTCHIWKFPG